MPGIHIKRASAADAERVGELFDLYRQFYQQPADRAGAIDYLRLRLQRGDSVVLMAMVGEGELAGFCQLYPTFCSVDMAPISILYDLYVGSGYRRQGVAGALLAAAEDQARAQGAVRMELATATDNISAQRLYEASGWERDRQFLHYSKLLGSG
jgi:GNAT superfamily N-acetyltransferase